MTEEVNVIASGHLKKMVVTHEVPVKYNMVLDDDRIDLSPYIGRKMTLRYRSEIHCTACGRKTKKSFNQGYCYPCFTKLAQCDSCIMSPEKCHYDAGTCREPEWGETFCMTDHIVYLANSSGIKVGITRENQVPTRWIDQGAVAALPIFRVATRQLSGLIETELKAHVADKTNWRKMLKNEVEEIDLIAERDRLLPMIEDAIIALKNQHGADAIAEIDDAEVYEFDYPVEEYPTKVTSHNFDKNNEVTGVLKGIKGQYLIFDTGVINLRKFTAYHIDFIAQ